MAKDPERHNKSSVFRVASWNCNMALHRKLEALDELDADIAILPEIARPDIVARKAPGFIADRCVWDGGNPNKGLGILAKSYHWEFRLDDSYDPSNGIVMPVQVSGPVQFNLMAVWSLHVNGKKATSNAPGAVIRALETSAEFCRDAPLVVAGDFNNSAIWDRPGNVNNMAAIDEILRDYGLVSAYHVAYSAQLGSEPDPTLYWRDRKRDGYRYHIDYIYIPRAWTRAHYSLTVGGFDDWVGSGRSDHVPLVVEFPMAAVTASS